MLQLYPAAVTVLALLLYVAFFVQAARMRARHRIPAPATTGHPDFERALRVQANTIEHLVIFLPALWLCAMYVSWVWASVVGLLWIPARLLYAVAYCRDPARRGPGFILATVVELALLGGAGIGIAIGFLR